MSIAKEKITIIGKLTPSGVIRSFIQQAIEKGHPVRALVPITTRNNPIENQENLTIIRGDVFDKNVVLNAIQEADIVFSCIDPTTDYPGVAYPTKAVQEVLNDAVKDLPKDKVPQLILLSVIGVGDTYYNLPYWMRFCTSWLWHGYISDKIYGERLLRDLADQITVKWTILRPSMFKYGGALTRKVKSDEVVQLGTFGGSISPADIAHFVLKEVIVTEDWINRAITITT